MKDKVPSLPALSIERPVLAIVMSLVIVFAGILAWTKLPVREYPDIDPPVVTVTTVYPGASSKVIESEITDILEEELAGIEGIRTMVSSSRDQVSSITVEFVLERDIDVAAQDVRDKISRVARRLPENVDDPIIAKADSDAQPVIWIAIQSKTRNLIDLAEYVDKEIKDYFQNVPGVSKVIFGGERRRSIQVLIDTKKLAYYGLTIIDIEQALKVNNIELPAGTILSKTREFSINVDAKLTKAEEYGNIIIKQSRIGQLRLNDIAMVREGAQNDISFVRFNGQQGFGLGVVRQAKSNAVQISDDVKKLVTKLQKTIPKDIELLLAYDAAQFIRLSMHELYESIMQATLLVLFVIFIFLRNMRSTLIPGIAIPISLVGVMAGLQLMHFTINQMTLLGLIISIGIVVDDSIIVLENIYRYIEGGMEPKEAAKKGAEEITFAVLATTLVLISIFLPVGFLTGITGRLLSEFAFALCFAVGVSAFVSLTMVPMLCSRILKPHKIATTEETELIGSKPGKRRHIYEQIKIVLENCFVWLENTYERSLAALLNRKLTLIIVLLIVCIPSSIYLFMTLPTDFIPNEDRGSFIVAFKSTTGSNVEVMDRQIRKVENILAKIPEVATTIAVAAFGRDAPGKPTEGIIITRLKDWKLRSRKAAAIVGPLYPQFFAMPEMFTMPILPKSGPDAGFGSQPIQLVIKSNDLDFLIKASTLITTKSFTLAGIMFARSNVRLDKPELSVEIDRDKALSLGVSMTDISRSIELLFTGIDVTEFNDKGEKYEVILKVPRTEKEDIRNIGEFAVRNNSGALIQLSNIIKIHETIGADDRNHHNRKKSITIEASPKPGTTPAEGLIQLETMAKEVIESMENVPADFEIDYLGTSKELKDSSSALYFGFFVALVFAFLFLAGQFESFISPLIIMMTVPLALFGALVGLYVFQFFPWITKVLVSILGPDSAWLQYVIPQFENITLNLYSQVGMIMLIGMATKNGILLVEFMNQLREQGVPLMDAIKRASKLRLRPVLMTAISTIVGTVPIALALGIGTESRQSLGVVIIFGMGLSTLLTLYFIPCLYGLVFKDKKQGLALESSDGNHSKIDNL